MTATHTFFLGLSLIAVGLVALSPVEAVALAGQVKAAFIDAYTVNYFDRATWNVGCY
ncbi:MAG: hypothetical protein HOH04_04545 [Rhodospirillaceae bacterium]|jgi:hypothetical protein|nr:hypothetical protein [Rhodospirillaceae bacterium]